MVLLCDKFKGVSTFLPHFMNAVLSAKVFGTCYLPKTVNLLTIVYGGYETIKLNAGHSGWHLLLQLKGLLIICQNFPFVLCCPLHMHIKGIRNDEKVNRQITCTTNIYINRDANMRVLALKKSRYKNGVHIK